MKEEILSRLDLLAAKLGHTATALWPHAVRHTAIKAASEVFLVVFSAALATFLILTGSVFGSRRKWEEGPWIMPLAAGIVLAVITLLFGIGLPDSIAAALEPTGHTVKAILRGRH